MAEVTNALPVGELVGNNYEILGIAGAGGMGIVYRAWDAKLERTVALKFLPTLLNADVREREYFVLEARMASSVDHPNIGVIHGIEETTDGHAFIVMGFYDGLSLAQRIAKGPLSTLEAVDVAIQVALGLCEAHSHHIVHRDIKPSNVMLTNTRSVKIVDFGLARLINAETATASGIVGSIKYVSPEQALGQRTDQRTDIWSLGVVLAEMLAGRNPFDRGTIPAILVAILNEPPQLLDGLPIALQGIIYRSLSKDTEKRYQHCSEMLADLQAAQAELSNDSTNRREAIGRKTTSRSNDIRRYVEQASISTWSRAQKPRNRWLPLGLGLCGLVLLACLFLFPRVREQLGSRIRVGEEHIAVLPFTNIGNNPENQALSEGLVDTLSGKLSDLDVGNKALWVIPASEIRRLRVTDPSAALKMLGANLVISGSIRRDGTAVNLNLNLINTKNLRLIGSVDVVDQAGDLSALQDEAVSRLAHLMDLPVSAEMLHNTGGSVVPAAYQNYLTALGYMQRYDKAGNLDQAIEVLNAAIETDPKFALGYGQLGEAYRLKYQLDRNQHWLDEAQGNLEKAIQLDSSLPAAYVTLGRIHDVSGKRELALQEFQHALQLDPRNAMAMRGMARAYERSGRVADAEAAYKKAVALKPDDWESYNLIGNFYDRQGKYPEAITALRRAIDMTPDNAEVYLNLGATYVDSGDSAALPTAEQALKRSIELGPTYPAYANLASLYLAQRRYRESAEVNEKALRLNENDYMVWNNLLIAYERLGDSAKAKTVRERIVPLLEQNIRLKPQDAQAHSLLAVMQAKDGVPGSALEHAQTAIALSPDDPSILVNVAGAYEMCGDRKQALGYLEMALHKGFPLSQLENDPDMRDLLRDPGFHFGKPSLTQ
ncbi:serine/threonine-protein kinase [Tunturiibacter gelidoferens]|uniref:Serine/threonine-protein kinase n=1 Tax=Tunturiibacter gelidiferens TaxID=3069689 RepID=A0ACC5P3R3_9BACT|nr:serine/threonine-protein kinase [Edaphobacter lichenicola]MBB5341360.1 serine/threonine-protein kinase [Edaphobacter lichenicola]